MPLITLHRCGHAVYRLAVIAVLAVSAVGLSQLPLFTDVYADRLSESLERARTDVDVIISHADTAGVPAYALVSAHMAASDPVQAHMGHVMQARINRAGNLVLASDALAASGIVERPISLFRFFDMGIAVATLRTFEPAWPSRIDSLAYVALGVPLIGGLIELARLALRLMGRVGLRSTRLAGRLVGIGAPRLAADPGLAIDPGR